MSATELLAVYRKGAVAVAGVLAQALLVLQQLTGSGLLHGQALATVQLVAAVLTAAGVVIARNSDTSDHGVPPWENGDPSPIPLDPIVDDEAELALSGSTSPQDPDQPAAGVPPTEGEHVPEHAAQD